MRIDRHGTVVIAALTGIGGLMILGGSLSWVLYLLGGAVVLLGAVALGLIVYVETRIFPEQFRKKKLARWFEEAVADLAGAPPPNPPRRLGTVRVTALKFRSNNLTHSKLVIDRGVEAVVLGSPFGQNYFDSQHVLDDPRRGRSASKGPIHEVSVAVRGPAVGHLQEVFNSHWNLAEPSDLLPVSPTLPQPLQSVNPGEFNCSVQIVRTFDSMFTPQGDGEKGVLEAYLRAIHFAERFIYFENQYFNNDAITQALIDALERKPALQVILLLNAAPDMPLYLGWQQKAIRRIADSLRKKNIDPATRFGVFSTWTHESAQSTGSSKPSIVDNYLHSKTALIDNRWATVGSANLDGASLDTVQYARAFFDDDVRNTEANVVVFGGAATTVPAVDALRRRLWSEHLGYTDPADNALNDPPGIPWLNVWRQRAQAKRDMLKQDLNNVSEIRILEWPSAAFEETLSICKRLTMHRSHATAAAYLRTLLKPKEVPSDIVVTTGPGGYEFTYGAFPNTEVPGSLAPASTSPAISDEAET